MTKLSDRKSHRLKQYDYSQNGYYYVTVLIYNRNLLFGNILNKKPVGTRRAVSEIIPEININQYGKIVREEWENTQRLRNNITLDEYVIMPNHIHGIIIINDTDTARRVPTGQFGKPISGSLSTIIGSFKSAVTKRINELRQTTLPPVWQKLFYDHVIRTDISLQNIRQYIINNPATWDNDEYNPNN